MPPAARPRLTIAIVHHCLKGYPALCARSFAAELATDAEVLVLAGEGGAAQASSIEPLRHVLPRARIIPLDRGDRATAKNRAIAEAQGEHLLLLQSDRILTPGAAGTLQDFLLSRREPTAAAAQMLNENGNSRRSAFAFPSLARELNIFHWLRRQSYLLRHDRNPPRNGGARAVAALPAWCLMAPRDLFRRVGPFREGLRFGYEDVEWSARAARQGVGRFIVHDARAHSLAPQLRGMLPPEAYRVMEDSFFEMARAVRGESAARLLRRVRRLKAGEKWLLAALCNGLLGGRSVLFSHAVLVNRALWRHARTVAPQLAPDAESDLRWETFA